MRAQHLAQRLVHEMRRGVIGPRGRAALVVDDQLDRIARLEAAALDNAGVHDQIAELLLRIADTEQRAFRALDEACIADLATGTGCGQLKTGAPARGERIAKYNRLVELADANTDLPYGLAPR